ncbi:MAG: xanthine dehydrogenase family protein molybdopterin-binding subunit [Actinomycetia bacterium]|nr:xanthine dehydrogenase family protein molybdopterin-binding subunit [Actinomycetes bacterium]
MGRLSVVGTSLPRVDAWDKVTGRAEYAFDVELPDMLHVKVLRSAYAHARILSVDTSKAQGLPGVRAVITGADMPKDPPLEALRNELYAVPPFSLATDKARYTGEEIAAVAAEDELTAEEALQWIRVEYEPLPAVIDPEEAMKPGAPQIHDDAENNIQYENRTEFGDVEKGFAEADHVFEDRFSTQLVHPCTLERTVCIAAFDSSGYLTFYDNSIDPYKQSRYLPKLLGIEPSRLRIVQKAIGSNFGALQGNLTPYIMCALLAKKAGRPVKLVYTREEEFINAGPRHMGVCYLRTGVKNDGTVTARDIRLITNAGAYGYLGPAMMTSGFTPCAGLYRCPNVRFEGKCVYTNTAVTSPYRSFGIVPPAFAMESMMNIIAEELGMDPVALRLKNITRQGDVTVVGQEISSSGLPECIEKTVAHIGWKEKRGRLPPNRGVGMACGMFDSEVRNAPFAGSVAYVKLLEDGRVKVISGEFEWGQGSRTVLSQIAAEELGVPLESVLFSELDTAAVPYALGPYGGGPVTLRGGNAVRLAAVEARRQLFAVAAGMLSVGPDDLELKDQKVVVRDDPVRALSSAQVAHYAKFILAEEIIGRGHFEPDTVMRDPKTYYGNYSSGYTFTAQTVEVAVDPETGQVRILDFASAIDLGKAINPMAADGQNEGCVGQELGPILLESLAYDKQGRVVNPNLVDYRLPTALDVPPITSFLVESHEPHGPYGAKACGQVSNIPAAAALAGAIYDAVGVWIKDQPITPDKILRALAEKEKREHAPA